MGTTYHDCVDDDPTMMHCTGQALSTRIQFPIFPSPWAVDGQWFAMHGSWMGLSRLQVASGGLMRKPRGFSRPYSFDAGSGLASARDSAGCSRIGAGCLSPVKLCERSAQ